MTREQIAVFEQLLNDKDFKGKKELKHLLWINTTKPKFKNGECFKVTDPGHKIFGYPVINFGARIVRSFSWRDTDEWHYELQMVCDCEGKQVVSKVYKSERELDVAMRCSNNTNVLGAAKSKYSESLDA